MDTAGKIHADCVIDNWILKYYPSKVGREIITSWEFTSLMNKMQVPFASSVARFSNESLMFVHQDDRRVHSLFAGGLALKLAENYGYKPWMFRFSNLIDEIKESDKIESKMKNTPLNISRNLLYDTSDLVYRRPFSKNLEKIQTSKKKRDKLEERLSEKYRCMSVVDTAPIAKAQKIRCKDYSGPLKPYQSHHDPISDVKIHPYLSNERKKIQKICEGELDLTSVPLKLSSEDILNLE